MKKRSTEIPPGITLQSFGGVEDLITGSSHRLRLDKKADLLVDFGLFQGRREERSGRGVRRNFSPIGDIANGSTQLLFTHPHIDHTGQSPRLVRGGLSPDIITTHAAAAFIRPLLLNSAYIQESGEPDNQLYETADAEKALRLMRPVSEFTPVDVGGRRSHITAEFLHNGHVMGSSSILVRAPDQGKNFLFTGDMGKPEQSLCGGYVDFAARYPLDPVHVLVVESTNIEKQPVPFVEKEANLLNKIKDVWNRGGTPAIASLSFHRLQEIVEILHHHQGGLIPPDCQIIIDAPLGVEILETFRNLGDNQLSRRYGDNPRFYQTSYESRDRFTLDNRIIIRTHEQSAAAAEALANYSGKAIIIASGGMFEHGRVVNYLRGGFAANPKNAFLVTCHQVDGTRGAALIGAKEKPLKASIEMVPGFTSHISGPEQTFDFLGRFDLSGLETVVITHGNKTARAAMAAEFGRRYPTAKVHLPKIGEIIEI